MEVKSVTVVSAKNNCFLFSTDGKALKDFEMQTESCSKELPERCAEALPESCSGATKPEQAGSSAASAVEPDATEHAAESSRGQRDEDLVRDIVSWYIFPLFVLHDVTVACLGCNDVV